MAKITTPVEGYSGETAGVQFRNGVGHSDDPAALRYFRRRGYTVTDEPEQADDADQGEKGTDDPGTSEQGGGTSLFDPAAHGVDAVNEHLSAASPAERERVLTAEAAGKGRVSILNGPHADIAGLDTGDNE